MTEVTNDLRHPLCKRVGALAFVVLAGYGAGNIAAKAASWTGVIG